MLRTNREEAVSAVELSMDLFFKEFHDAGLRYGVVMGRASPGNGAESSSDEEIAEFCHTYPDMFCGFAGIAPVGTGRALVRQAHELGMVGIALDSGFWDIHHDDRRLDGIYEAAAEQGMIVALTSSQLMGPDLSFAHPDRVRAVAKRYPTLSFVVSHACWPWTTLACALAFECPNVFLLPDCYLNLGAPGTEQYVRAGNGFMRAQLLYGSAYPGQPLGNSVKAFDESGLDTDAIEHAQWHTPLRLLLAHGVPWKSDS